MFLALWHLLWSLQEVLCLSSLKHMLHCKRARFVFVSLELRLLQTGDTFYFVSWSILDYVKIAETHREPAGAGGKKAGLVPLPADPGSVLYPVLITGTPPCSLSLSSCVRNLLHTPVPTTLGFPRLPEPEVYLQLIANCLKPTVHR